MVAMKSKQTGPWTTLCFGHGCAENKTDQTPEIEHGHHQIWAMDAVKSKRIRSDLGYESFTMKAGQTTAVVRFAP